MRVDLVGQKTMNHIVSHIEGVKRAVKHEAEDVLDLAEALHEEYHDSDDKWETRFSVTTGDTDSFANMDHPAVIPREFGWVHPRSGKIVPGKYTMQRAAHAGH